MDKNNKVHTRTHSSIKSYSLIFRVKTCGPRVDPWWTTLEVDIGEVESTQPVDQGRGLVILSSLVRGCPPREIVRTIFLYSKEIDSIFCLKSNVFGYTYLVISLRNGIL